MPDDLTVLKITGANDGATTVTIGEVATECGWEVVSFGTDRREGSILFVRLEILTQGFGITGTTLIESFSDRLAGFVVEFSTIEAMRAACNPAMETAAQEAK